MRAVRHRRQRNRPSAESVRQPLCRRPQSRLVPPSKGAESAGPCGSHLRPAFLMILLSDSVSAARKWDAENDTAPSHDTRLAWLGRRGRSHFTSAAPRNSGCPNHDVRREQPLRQLEGFGRRRKGGAGRWHLRKQAIRFRNAVRFILGFHPIGVNVAGGLFVGCPEPAFHRALQERFEKGRCDRHGGRYASKGALATNPRQHVRSIDSISHSIAMAEVQETPTNDRRLRPQNSPFGPRPAGCVPAA